MMLINFSSICNLLCLLVVHTVVVKMNKYSDENELTNFNENYFCEDVFDNKQCNYIRNVLRAIIDLYEMNNSKQKKNTADNEQSYCRVEIKKLIKEVNKIKHKLNTLSRKTGKLLKIERSHNQKSKYVANTANGHYIGSKSDDTDDYKYSTNTDFYKHGGSVNQLNTRFITEKYLNVKQLVCTFCKSNTVLTTKLIYD